MATNLRQIVEKKFRSDAREIDFYAFDDLSDNVKQRVERIRTTPFIPRKIRV